MAASVVPCEDGSTELDCRFLLEVQELLAPQTVTQLLEDFQGGLSSDLELFPPPHASDQDCSSCSSRGTPAVLPMRVRGKGFNVLRAPLGNSTDTPVSIFQSFSEVSPDQLGGHGHDSAVWDLTKLALSSYYCNTDLLDQVIQAVLLSESTILEQQQPAAHETSAL